MHFDNSGYKDLKLTENVGFCNRFTETTGKNDKECIGFILSDEKEKYFRNLAKAAELKIQLKNQLELF